MIYVIHVYVIRHSPNIGIHPPIANHSEFYIVGGVVRVKHVAHKYLEEWI